jgi:hypothetical protein
MQGHGLATLFLAGVGKGQRESKLRVKFDAVLPRAVKYIVRAQSSEGGWYHTSRMEGHDFAEMSTTAIQIQALQAAENAGIPVPGESVDGAQDYLKRVISEQKKRRPADTAAALACRFRGSPLGLSGYGNGKDALLENWLQHCRNEIPVGQAMKFGRDEMAHLYYAQALFNGEGETWTAYRTAMFDHLTSSQNKDGSWPAAEGWGVGPVYSTALWCIVLQLDNRSHPSLSPRFTIVD